MSQPTFSKGTKSRLVDLFPLGRRSDFVMAHDVQTTLSGGSLNYMPDTECCILDNLSLDMCPRRMCQFSMCDGVTVEIDVIAIFGYSFVVIILEWSVSKL